jgi:hypothetical protein
LVTVCGLTQETACHWEIKLERVCKHALAILAHTRLGGFKVNTYQICKSLQKYLAKASG